jgi:hypothetical protein
MDTVANVSFHQVLQWGMLTSTAFLRDWLESCREAGKSGWDEMPWEWEPYLPDEGEIVIRPSTFLNAPAVITSVRGPPPSVVPVVTSTAGVATSIEVPSPSATSGPETTLSTSVTGTANITKTTTETIPFTTASIVSGPALEATSLSPAPIIVTSRSLSPGAIGGIVAGILALAILCAGLGYFYWKSNKKAKRKTREVAILSDRVSGCGFQKYIDDLLADSANDSHGDSNSSTGTIVRHPAPTAGMQEMTAASTTTVDGVVSQSSSVYSMDTARAI